MTINTDSHAGTLAGALNGAGGLTIQGAGTLILSGTNSYGGGTNVEDGKLYLTNSDAIPYGTDLTVGADGTFILDPAAGGASSDAISLLAASPALEVAAVPEPSTLVLLAAGALGPSAARGASG